MRSSVSTFLILVCAGTSSALADQVIAPSADGTLVDGGGYGNFDGLADAADWSYNQSSFEGAITVSHDGFADVEHRLVFEFNLSGVTIGPPVTAGLRFTLRGAPRFPAEAAIVQVFAFPSDLLETLADFSAGPSEFLAQVDVAAFQPPAVFRIDVSDQVNAALATSARRVAFRFQLPPQTQSAQAFIDAVDTDPATKPNIVVSDSLPGDLDNDGDIDLEDYAVLIDCMAGPALGFTEGCSPSDLNGDAHIDLEDLRILETRHTIYGQ